MSDQIKNEAAKSKDASEGKSSYCTFRVNDLLFGIEVSNVQEVIRHQPTTCVPLSSNLIGGLMNLRGQIVTALDLRNRFGFPPSDGESNHMNVVVRSSDGPISLLVDSIGDVAEVDDFDFESSPETLSDEIDELLDGVVKLDNELLLIINTENVIQIPETDSV
jgi:purine-binding chemotaxis protein CheW